MEKLHRVGFSALTYGAVIGLFFLILVSYGFILYYSSSNVSEFRLYVELEKGLNEVRLENNLNELEDNLTLNYIAYQHTSNMAYLNEISHVIFNESISERLENNNYYCASVGENLAVTPITLFQNEKSLADNLINQWLQSEGHKENLLYQGFNSHGVAVVINNNQVFATHILCYN